MIPPDEQRHVERGPEPGEVAGGVGVLAVGFAAPDPAAVLGRAAEVMRAVLAQPGGVAPSLPGWFVDGCAEEQSPEETQAWVRRWRSLPPAEQLRMESEQPWALEDWLHWMDPHERTWFWWDGRVVGPEEALVEVEVPGWPAPVGALEWLLRVAGAERVHVDELP